MLNKHSILSCTVDSVSSQASKHNVKGVESLVQDCLSIAELGKETPDFML